MNEAEAKACGDQTPGLSQSWAATVEAMLGPVYRFVKARAPADAVDDLVQETFVAASRGIADFDNRSPLWNWLTAIARNKIADHYRRCGSSDPLAQALGGLSSDDGQVRQALVSESPLPNEICERREFQALARAALSALGPRQRECLVARYYEDLSLEELSERFGISPAAANTRLHRARQELRQEFLKLIGGTEDHQEITP